MRIECSQKLDKALKFAKEQDTAQIAEMKRLLWNVHGILNNMDSEEAKNALKLVHQVQDALRAPLLSQTLTGCLSRLVELEACSVQAMLDGRIKEASTYYVYSDFGEHTFRFYEERHDDFHEMCGGIVYHGCPADGWKENGSVSLEPQYGWQIHT